METTNNYENKLKALSIEELKETAKFYSFMGYEDDNEQFNAVMQELAARLSTEDYDDFCLTLTY